MRFNAFVCFSPWNSRAGNRKLAKVLLMKIVFIRTLWQRFLKKNASILSEAARGFYEELMVLLRCAVEEGDFRRELPLLRLQAGNLFWASTFVSGQPSAQDAGLSFKKNCLKIKFGINVVKSGNVLTCHFYTARLFKSRLVIPAKAGIYNQTGIGWLVCRNFAMTRCGSPRSRRWRVKWSANFWTALGGLSAVSCFSRELH